MDSFTGRSRDPDHPRTASMRVREPGTAPELELGAPERWVLAKVRRRGVAGFVIQMTALGVVASVVLTTTMMVIFYPVEASYLEPAIFLGALVPALVAPPLLVFCVRLAARLDSASHLLWQAARTDSLTGIPNRRAYFEALDEAAAAPPRAYDVALLDIDSFKAINDRHGHEAGDLALEAGGDVAHRPRRPDRHGRPGGRRRVCGARPDRPLPAPADAPRVHRRRPPLLGLDRLEGAASRATPPSSASTTPTWRSTRPRPTTGPRAPRSDVRPALLPRSRRSVAWAWSD